MKKVLTLALTLTFFSTVLGQETNRDLAMTKAREAIKLMDSGAYEESISILEKCKEIDKESYLYSYEIGLAYLYQKDYKNAINELKRTVKYRDLNSEVFQLLGNAYSLSGEREKAIKTYNRGLSKFENAGNLYLEIGNVFLYEEEYDEAINNYEKGISVAPMYSSNYYRLAKLYLDSKDKVPGLIYGEIFMNIERTTERTQEMSELLYSTYENALEVSGDSMSVNFSQVVITLSIDDFNEGKDIEFPYSVFFERDYILASIGENEMTPYSLSRIRERFIDVYYQDLFAKYPVILFDYHKEMIDKDLFEAYNLYLFQISNPDVFNEWLTENEEIFDKFVEWYTADENVINVTVENKYIRY